MIIATTPRGRCKLDRIKQLNAPTNQVTFDFYDGLAEELGCSRADVVEGVQRKSASDPYFLAQLKHGALEAQNENRKRPQSIDLDDGDEPELTPEAAVENLNPVIKEAITQGQLVGEVSAAPVITEQSTPKAEGPNLWTNLTPAVMSVIGADNFEMWLSSVRLLSASDRILLSCPNTFFQEYLTEHYTEVIQEALQSAGDHRLVGFEVVTPAPAATIITEQSTPKDLLLSMLRGVTTLEELEAFESRTFPKLYQSRIQEAATRVQRYQGDALNGKRKAGFNEAQMAEEIAILRTQRIEEEEARKEFSKRRRGMFRVCRVVEQLRQKGDPRSQRQYARPSHFDSDGPLTRAELRS